MPRRISARAAALPLLAALSLAGCGAETPSGIPWMSSIPRALEQAKATGKPVLLHFYGPG